MADAPNRPWTPGPWHVFQTGATTATIAGEGSDYPGARMQRDHHAGNGGLRLTRPADLADEALIALAPEMAEAFFQMDECLEADVPIDNIVIGILDRLRAIEADNAR